MSDQIERQAGVIEGASRALSELMAARRTKETLRILGNNLDPGNADLLVDAVAEDPARLMDALSLLPNLANAGIVAAAHGLRRLSGLPAAMRREFAAQQVADLDAERLGVAAGRVAGLVADLADAEGVRQATREAEDRFARGFASAASRDDRRAWARTTADGIRGFGARHPRFVEDVARPLADAIRDVLDGAEGGDDAR